MIWNLVEGINKDFYIFAYFVIMSQVIFKLVREKYSDYFLFFFVLNCEVYFCFRIYLEICNYILF